MWVGAEVRELLVSIFQVYNVIMIVLVLLKQNNNNNN